MKQLQQTVKWDCDKEDEYVKNRKSAVNKFSTRYTSCSTHDVASGWYYNDLRLSLKNRDLRIFLLEKIRDGSWLTENELRY